MSAECNYSSKEPDSNTNRRKYLRISLQHQITLTELDNSNRDRIYSAKAKTLDLSMGGMRLSTDQPMQNDTVIQFAFDDALLEHPLMGIGHIAWCNKQQNAKGYQVGIVFEEQQFIQQMENYLSSVYS